VERLNWPVTVLVLALALSYGASIARADAILTGTINGANPNSTSSTLTISVSQAGFTAPTGSVFAQLSVNQPFTGTGSLVATAYADNSNTLFGTGITLDTATLFPYIGPSVPFIATAPYSLTLILDITLGPHSSMSLASTIRVSDTPIPAAVPEPSSVLLTATGLGMMVLTAWRRRRRGLS
jgi:PEP-CTERM motif